MFVSIGVFLGRKFWGKNGAMHPVSLRDCPLTSSIRGRAYLVYPYYVLSSFQTGVCCIYLHFASRIFVLTVPVITMENLNLPACFIDSHSIIHFCPLFFTHTNFGFCTIYFAEFWKTLLYFYVNVFSLTEIFFIQFGLFC